MNTPVAVEYRPNLSENHYDIRAEMHTRELQLLAHLRQAAEIHDPDSVSHMLRMSQYAHLIARGLGLNYEQQEVVLAAAPLHDIGKIGVPDAILKKRGPLDEIEQVVARRHVRHGHAILRHSTSSLVVSAAEIALRHHERFDGTGYPDGLSGEAIPLYARIAAVADVFDALTSHRPHRPAVVADQALDHLRSQRGTHFDPDCVDAFIAEERRIRDIRIRYRDPCELNLTGN